MESEGYAASVLDGSRLYVAGGEYVYCLDADTGEEEWSRRLFGAVTGLAREGELLVATTAAGEVYALDTSGGRGEWRASVPAGIETAPDVSGQRVAVGCRDFAVYGFDTAGRRAWSTELGNVGGLAATHETVYASEKTETTALNRETGERRWSVDHGGVYRHGSSPPALEGDTVYVGGDGVHAVDPGSGPLGLQFDRVRSERSLGGTVGHVSSDPDGTTLYGGVQRNRGPYEYVALEVR
ncbi:PQQ-like domain-containing protein [Halogranum amylolyticum]|uniref:PQQ-like domain-containing protein n=1 Tax=Halogranum amylolyticum TaxID=660520 RepID=A0A1H8N9Z4_9EURY|nr:PQQ-binding-like beta-propeller repeat protein [Halogranum amylolyticum]SEO26372.1 PQQ-like domain-containing protein [Halogranum amylolyticum]